MLYVVGGNYKMFPTPHIGVSDFYRLACHNAGKHDSRFHIPWHSLRLWFFFEYRVLPVYSLIFSWSIDS